MALKEQDQQTQCEMAERLEAKMDKILSRIDQIEENIESKFSVLSKRVSELESKVEKLIKDVDTTKLLANDAQFETKNLKDTLAVTQKLIITHLAGQTYVWHSCKWSFAGPQIYLQPAEIKSEHFGVSLKFFIWNWKSCIWRLNVCQNFSFQVCLHRTTSVRNIRISDCIHT